jgi:hypothetical protein
MASKHVKILYGIADMLEQSHQPRSADKCRTAGQRMEILESVLLERLIDDVKKGDE